MSLILFYFIFQAERAEKEKMKQVVLGIHERQEEEDYQGNKIKVPLEEIFKCFIFN